MSNEVRIKIKSNVKQAVEINKVTLNKVKREKKKLNEDLVITVENFTEKYEKMYYFIFNNIIKKKILFLPEDFNFLSYREQRDFLDDHIADIMSYLYELLTIGDSRGKVAERLTSTWIYNQIWSYKQKLLHKEDMKDKYKVYSLDSKINNSEDGENYLSILPDTDDYESSAKTELDSDLLIDLKTIISKNKEALSIYNRLYKRYDSLRKKQLDRIEKGTFKSGKKNTIKVYNEEKSLKMFISVLTINSILNVSSIEIILKKTSIYDEVNKTTSISQDEKRFKELLSLLLETEKDIPERVKKLYKEFF